MGPLSSFGLVETDAAHLRRARKVQRLLAAKSQRGRKIPYLLIAAAAEGQALQSFISADQRKTGTHQGRRASECATVRLPESGR